MNEEKNAEEAKEFDPSSLVGYNLKLMADAYGVSVPAFKRSISVIQKQLDAEKHKVRPGCKRGAQGFTLCMVLLVVAHLGNPKIK